MKEITHEDWLKNPTLREMWVWDNETVNKTKAIVIYILSEEQADKALTYYPVLTSTSRYKHCAELEPEPEPEPEKRPCTREKLLEMLKKQGLPMVLCKDNNSIYSIVRLDNEGVTIISILGSSITNVYKELCEKFTLLDGTELWVNDVPQECVSPTPDEIGG